MAELATIARPYAEALFKVQGQDRDAVAAQLSALARVADDAQVQQLAGNPKTPAALVYNVVSDVAARAGTNPGPQVEALLRTMIENRRLPALGEVATQYRALAAQSSGVHDAVVESAFPMDDAQLGELTAALQKRFGRQLKSSVVVKPELIGGVRVTVGDEVLDTSVAARLQQMKTALTA